MFESEYYVNITGHKHYYGVKPFSVGALVALVKQPDNKADADAICAEMPLIGTVGYVANSAQTVAEGCLCATQLQGEMADSCAAVVRFVSRDTVIARVLPHHTLEVHVLAKIVPADAQEAGEDDGMEDLADRLRKRFEPEG